MTYSENKQSKPLIEIVEVRNLDGSISFTYKQAVEYKVTPQVILPPYRVFFPTINHHIEIRKRYYEAHNYLCKGLHPEREFAFIIHLQQYQPAKDYSIEIQSHRPVFLGLLPHEK